MQFSEYSVLLALHRESRGRRRCYIISEIYIYIYIAYEKDNTKQYMLIKKRGVEKIILEEFSKGRFIFSFSSHKVRRTKI